MASSTSNHTKTALIVIFVSLFGLCVGYWYGKTAKQAQSDQQAQIEQESSYEPTLEPLVTVAPDMTHLPAATNIKTYLHPQGLYAFTYPTTYTLNEGFTIGVDGVKSASPNVVQLVSPTRADGMTNFAITITTKDIPLSFKGNLEELFNLLMSPEIKSKQIQITSGQLSGALYPDTPYGPNGASYLFVSQDSTAYQFTIESHQPFTKIRSDIETVLAGFKFLK